MKELEWKINETKDILNDISKLCIEKKQQLIHEHDIYNDIIDIPYILSQDVTNNLKKDENNNHFIPIWLTTTANEIKRLTIEQQYQEAVNLALKVQSYFTNNKQNQNDEKLINIEEQCHEQIINLAQVLRNSLNNLVPSKIWGIDEQRNRIELLIALGHHKLAAEGFSSNQVSSYIY